MSYPDYFPIKYRYKPPIHTHYSKHKTNKTIQHIKRNKHHYHFVALSLTLAFLAALAVTLAFKTK